MIVGFTGTRQGMTGEQKFEVARLLRYLNPSIVLHGCCVGADRIFHRIVLSSVSHTVVIEGFPGDNEQKTWAERNGVESNPIHPYLERNKIIAKRSDIMIVTPKGEKEELRSGTWATIRCRKKTGLLLYIVEPSGSCISFGDTREEIEKRGLLAL